MQHSFLRRKTLRREMLGRTYLLYKILLTIVFLLTNNSDVKSGEFGAMVSAKFRHRLPGWLPEWLQSKIKERVV